MARTNSYAQGYADGRKAAEQIIANDLVAIHGITALILMENGYSAEEAEGFIIAVQDRWNDVIHTDESMRTYLNERLPFDIVQMVTGGIK